MNAPRNNRILIIDDQVELRERLAKLLSGSNDREKLSDHVKSLREKLFSSVSEAPEEGAPQIEYEVDTVGSGQDALERIKQSLEKSNPYALAFIDMRMPSGWDGLRTAEEIRKIDKDIEMVIMTAFADYDQKEVAERVGCPEKLLYIKKPFHVEEILQMALSLCSKWALLQEQKENNVLLENLLKTLHHLRTAPREKIEKIALESVCLFLKADGGFLARWDLKSQQWELKSIFSNPSDDKIKKFIDTNAETMHKASTRKHFGSDYFMPFGKDHAYALVAFNAECRISSQWYKIFDLLTMSVDIELSRS